MKGYSQIITENKENHAMARVEDVDASYKDLSEVCNRISNLTTERALELLEKFKQGERPVLYKSRNKGMGHRKELNGQKGRYPKKVAGIVLAVVKSAVANAIAKGMIEPYIIVHVSANKKRIYPRMAPKGRRNRSNYETARVEVILREKEIVKKEKKEKLKTDKKKETEVKETGKTEEEKKKIEATETVKEKKAIEKSERKNEEKIKARTIAQNVHNTQNQGDM